jgi:hypothetical protein
MGKLCWIYNTYGYSEMMLGHFHPSVEVQIVDNFLQHPSGMGRQLLHRVLVPVATWCLERGMRRVAGFLVRCLYPARYLRALLALAPGDGVLVFDVTNPRTLRFVLRWLPRGVRFHDFFHNPMVPNAPLLCNKRVFRALQGEGVCFSTFDPKDAREFGMPCYGQFYFRPSAEELAVVPTFDFFFCGLPKDREEELLRLQHFLETEGYTCRFIFPHSRAERLTPAQYMELLRTCRCVIDMNQGGQVGLSRRPLEALFYKKKLITNNASLRELPFYRPANILLLPEESRWSEVIRFFNIPGVDVDNSITSPYEMNHWIEHFL